MFNFFKKKNEKIVNEVFGEMAYYPSQYGSGEWAPKEKFILTLWNKQYDLDINIQAPDRNSDLTIQEKVYTSLKENIEEKQKEIEKVLKEYMKEYYEEVDMSKLAPTELYLGSNGECVIAEFIPEEYMEERYDDEPGIAVWIFPEMRVDDEDDYLELC